MKRQPLNVVEVAEPIVAVPAIVSWTAPSSGDGAGDWLCAWCLNRVAAEHDRFEYGGRNEFAFSNPERICFIILTFSQTLGCRQMGVPTLEHTWFPAHAWSYCLCENCGQHLGWHYAGEYDFAGLIKERIVRSQPMRN
jgi:hypothetical protein